MVGDQSLGMDRPSVVDYPEPHVKLNMASGSGHYPYTGLDQFDRLLQALWQYYGSPNADREKVVYGYDLASNRLTRDNQLSGSGGQDEKYAYDGLWQVSTLDRGTLSGGNITSKVFGQAWTFDQTGNWANFKQDDNGDGTWDLNQDRTHNTANEIATIQVWGAVVHDPVGNMTRIPKPSIPANRYACIWDAWNRLVEVKETDGSGNPTTTVAVYAYDGFYRRTKKVIGASTRDYYYSLGWQVLEERVAAALDRQFVWGIRHIDDLVLRDRGAERLYAVHDAMHVTAVTNASGAVQERYGYDAFGKPRFMDASFGARSSSSFDWETLFDGYRFDTETGLYQVRFRYLHPGLGRWMSRDPLMEQAGSNFYCHTTNSPINFHDSQGLQMAPPGWPWNPPGSGQPRPPVDFSYSSYAGIWFDLLLRWRSGRGWTYRLSDEAMRFMIQRGQNPSDLESIIGRLRLECQLKRQQVGDQLGPHPVSFSCSLAGNSEAPYLGGHSRTFTAEADCNTMLGQVCLQVSDQWDYDEWEPFPDPREDVCWFIKVAATKACGAALCLGRCENPAAVPVTGSFCIDVELD